MEIAIEIQGDIDKFIRERMKIYVEGEVARLFRKTINILYGEVANVSEERWEKVILPLIRELEELIK